jgi:transposase
MPNFELGLLDRNHETASQDVEEVHSRAKQADVTVLEPPRDMPYEQFPNTRAGHSAFLKSAGSDVLRIVFEPTGPYHRAFEGRLAKAGLPLCKVNPLQARRFAQSIGTHAKTDRVDARLLARMGAILAIESRPVASEHLAELRELRQAHQALIKERTRIKNRRQILTVALLKRRHDQRLRQIEREVEEIVAAILERISAQETMARRFAILTSIPGIGQIAAIALIIDMPELGELNARQAASLAGVAPITRQSGNWRGKAMIGGGRKHLRDALFMPALVAARFNNDLRTVYERLTAAGKPPKLAITAVMRKLIVLANALIRNDRKWAPRMA